MVVLPSWIAYRSPCRGVIVTADHATHGTISHMRLGHTQQVEQTCNAQTCMTYVQVNKYHIQTCKTNIRVNKCHVQCINNEHTCITTMPDD